MKAVELIKQLQTLDPDSVVEIYDPETEHYQPVSGLVHDYSTKETQLYADVDDYAEEEEDE